MLKDYLWTFSIDDVCLQETIKQDFTDLELRSLECGDKFFWSWLPASSHSGGLLIGVRDNLFEVGNVDSGQFFISLSVIHRPSTRTFELIDIYGPADHSKSRAFLDEISAKISTCNLPVIMGGYFNLIRYSHDKNNNNINWPRINLFNDHIATCSGARYTWSNKRLNPVRSVLDRVFISASLEPQIPLCALVAESSLGSDHILLSSTRARAPRCGVTGSSSKRVGSHSPTSLRSF